MPTYTKYQDFVLAQAGTGIVPRATVLVTANGSSTHCTLYSSSTGSSTIANPVQADEHGYYWFYIDNTIHFDLTFSGEGIVTRQLTDVLAPGGGAAGVAGAPGPPGPPGGVTWGYVPATNDVAGINAAVALAIAAGKAGVGWPIVILQPGAIYRMGTTGVVISISDTPSTSIDPIFAAQGYTAGNVFNAGFVIWCPGLCLFDCTEFTTLTPALSLLVSNRETAARIEGIRFFGNSTFSIGTRVQGGQCVVDRCYYDNLRYGHEFRGDVGQFNNPGIFTESSTLSNSRMSGTVQTKVRYYDREGRFNSFRGTGMRGANFWDGNTNAAIVIEQNALPYMAPLEVDVMTSNGYSYGGSYLIDNQSNYSSVSFYGRICSENATDRHFIIGKANGSTHGGSFNFVGHLLGNRPFMRLGTCHLGDHLNATNWTNSVSGEEFAIQDQTALAGTGVLQFPVNGTVEMIIYIATPGLGYHLRYDVVASNVFSQFDDPVSVPATSPLHPPNGTVSVRAILSEVDTNGYGTFSSGHITFGFAFDGNFNTGVSFAIYAPNLVKRQCTCFITGKAVGGSERRPLEGMGGMLGAEMNGIDYSRSQGWYAAEIDDNTGLNVLVFVDATHFTVNWVNSFLSQPLGSDGGRFVTVFQPGTAFTTYCQPGGAGTAVTVLNTTAASVTYGANSATITLASGTIDSSLYLVALSGQ